MAALGVTLGVTLGVAAAARWLRPRPAEASKLPFSARVVAHRGGAGERIENTMEAFENAVIGGCDLLELDCRRSRDGVAVVSHDRDLRRQTGHALTLCDTDFRDLPPYKSPLEVTFAPGHFAHGDDRRFARLDDVFRRFPRQPMSIEIKEDDDELIAEVAALVRLHDRAPITLWASFRDSTLRKCRAAHPAMPYSFSLRRGLLLLLLYYTGLLPFVPLGESVLLFLLPSIINRTYFPVPKGWAGHLLSKVVEAVALRPPLLRHLRSRGIQVLLWVLNEEQDFAAAFAAGATGVVTDFPSRLRRYLDARPSPTPTAAEGEGQGEEPRRGGGDPPNPTPGLCGSHKQPLPSPPSPQPLGGGEGPLPPRTAPPPTHGPSPTL